MNLRRIILILLSSLFFIALVLSISWIFSKWLLSIQCPFFKAVSMESMSAFGQSLGIGASVFSGMAFIVALFALHSQLKTNKDQLKSSKEILILESLIALINSYQKIIEITVTAPASSGPPLVGSASITPAQRKIIEAHNKLVQILAIIYLRNANEDEALRPHLVELAKIHTDDIK